MLRQLLIVEDEPNIRELVRSHLESEGYECVAVADGRDALDLVNRRPFDVILLDLIPGADTVFTIWLPQHLTAAP